MRNFALMNDNYESCRTQSLRALCLATSMMLMVAPALLAQPEREQRFQDLTLSNYVSRVLERNETSHAKLLEMEVSRRKARAEHGVFEPELFGGVERLANNRENTVEQTRSSYSDVFWEKNNVYQGGIETLVPSGARVRMGYTLRDLENNLQSNSPFVTRGATNGEFQTFVGLSLTQPLLKGAGPAATMAGIRVAALESDIAFQEYRRQLMLTVATAEASYWNLYLAQEQIRFFNESLQTAEKILRDNRERLEAGKGSQLDVLEAEAGLALRKSKLSEAEQKLYEASARALSLCSETVLASNRLLRAVDQPRLRESRPVFFEVWRAAYDLNPEYQVQRFKLMQEASRLGYARNQRLPELNLKASYGFNGLGETPGDSWSDVEAGGFPSWAVGLELRVPLAGGIKGANDLAAARLRYRATQLTLREVETQMANSLDTALHKIQSSAESVRGYRTVQGFNQSLFDSALARLEVGKVDSRKVLEIEADLFEARNAVAEALVQSERAGLELELMQGAILKHRNLDLTKEALSARTAQLLRRGGLNDDRFRAFVQELQQDYGRQSPTPWVVDTPEQIRARQALDEKLSEMTPMNSSPAATTSETSDPLRDALRRRLQETTP